MTLIDDYYEIDPANMSAKEAKILTAYVKSQKKTRIYKDILLYSTVEEDGESKTYKFKLTNDLVGYLTNKNSLERFGVKSEKLGKGNYGSVFKLKGALGDEAGVFTYKKKADPNEKLVVKEEKLKKEADKQRVLQERECAHKAGHLAVKRVSTDNTLMTYTVMRRLYGRTLASIIRDDKNGRNVLCLRERFDLTLLMFLILDEQVQRPGLVHRDFNPKNIMVDDRNYPFTGWAIDYGFSKDKDVNDRNNEPVGTPFYWAPEVWHNQNTGFYTDVFSLARSIAELWHDLDYDPQNYWQAQRANLDPIFANVASDLPGLPETVRVKLRKLLCGMTKIRDARLSRSDALAKFQSILEDPEVKEIFAREQPIIDAKRRACEFLKVLKEMQKSNSDFATKVSVICGNFFEKLNVIPSENRRHFLGKLRIRELFTRYKEDEIQTRFAAIIARMQKMGRLTQQVTILANFINEEFVKDDLIAAPWLNNIMTLESHLVKKTKNLLDLMKMTEKDSQNEMEKAFFYCISANALEVFSNVTQKLQSIAAEADEGTFSSVKMELHAILKKNLKRWILEESCERKMDRLTAVAKLLDLIVEARSVEALQNNFKAYFNFDPKMFNQTPLSDLKIEIFRVFTFAGMNQANSPVLERKTL